MYGDGPQVELLDTRPPRPGRGRRQLIGGLVAAAAVGALIVARADHGGSHPSPSRPPLLTSPAPSPSSSAPPGVVISPDVAVARMGDTVYALDAGRLATIDLDTGERTEWPSAGVAPADRYAMLADPAARRLWLVAATDRRTTVDFLDPTSLAVTGMHEGRGEFMGAAVLDGRLYLGTTEGMEVVAQSPGAVPASPVLRGQPLAVVADPTRHRLVATIIGGRTIGIAAWPAGRRAAAVRAVAPIGKGDLAVAGGRIWAAGFGQHGVVVRLDPKTLRVVRHSPVEAEVGVGAYVVDAADRHLLVRSGAGDAGSDLWCIDAGSGAIVRHWSPAVGTAVLTDRGVVLLAPGAPLVRLPSGACRG